MTAIERNLQAFADAGWWVAVGLHNAMPAAVAIREGTLPVMRCGDSLAGAVSQLAGDLQPAVPEPALIPGIGWCVDTGAALIQGATPERARMRGGGDAGGRRCGVNPQPGQIWDARDGGSIYVVARTPGTVEVQRRPFGDSLAEPKWMRLSTFVREAYSLRETKLWCGRAAS